MVKRMWQYVKPFLSTGTWRTSRRTKLLSISRVRYAEIFTFANSDDVDDVQLDCVYGWHTHCRFIVIRVSPLRPVVNLYHLHHPFNFGFLLFPAVLNRRRTSNWNAFGRTFLQCNLHNDVPSMSDYNQLDCRLLTFVKLVPLLLSFTYMHVVKMQYTLRTVNKFTLLLCPLRFPRFECQCILCYMKIESWRNNALFQ